nr:hypothetical protein CFP56_67351 [Quercus suber]
MHISSPLPLPASGPHFHAPSWRMNKHGLYSLDRPVSRYRSDQLDTIESSTLLPACFIEHLVDRQQRRAVLLLNLVTIDGA